MSLRESMSSWLMAPIVSAATGTNKYYGVSDEYLFVFRLCCRAWRQRRLFHLLSPSFLVLSSRFPAGSTWEYWYLVGSHENKVVRRIGDDVTLSGRIFGDRAGGVAKTTEPEAENAVRSQSERKQLAVQFTDLHEQLNTRARHQPIVKWLPII